MNDQAQFFVGWGTLSLIARSPLNGERSGRRSGNKSSIAAGIAGKLVLENGRKRYVSLPERHIGLDGEEHGPMARSLVQSLCGSDESLWQVAEEAAVNCLIAQRMLWDGIYESVRKPGGSADKSMVV